jgi:hypothetical protein
VAADLTAPDGRGHPGGNAGTPAGQLVMHTAGEAARLLKTKQSWLERQAAARKVPFSMLGGSYHFSDWHLAEIVRMNEVPPVPPAVPPTARSSHKARRGGEQAATVAPLRPRPRGGPRRT